MPDGDDAQRLARQRKQPAGQRQVRLAQRHAQAECERERQRKEPVAVPEDEVPEP
ncbi:hypothetical protein [Massilia sp. TSP1-1-2]|uniref:hypothetical protein n=1 Tax=Massilia sp. TSP1-1-2 TaxID=2804649 RepID=UPI003CE6741E